MSASDSKGTVQITILDDGPYEVVGPITLQDESGNPIEVEAGEAVYLCRCGGSLSKPFCDETHSKIGFQGAIKAVQESEGG
jgi:3-phenylpropionate/trans-cinnamate dioxygenase ferredoxin subunit